MSWRARVFHATSGAFLAALNVRAASMLEAEQAAISKVALLLRGHPAEMDVRHLAQLPTVRRSEA